MKMKTMCRHMRVMAIMTLVAVALGAGFFGCEEKDVPYVIDEDELIAFVLETAEGKDLFRTDGLINPDAYTVPFEDAVYRDSVLSVKRSFEVSLVPLRIPDPDPGARSGDSITNEKAWVDYGYLGELREALVQVVDEFTVQTAREFEDTTRYDTTTRQLTRYGFFLKLGDDARPYVGWSLWGFNGLGTSAPPVEVRVERYDGSNFPGDMSLYRNVPLSQWSTFPRVPYVKLTDIDTVVVASRVRIYTAKVSSSVTPTYQLLSDYTDSGVFTSKMFRYDGINYYDSLSYKIQRDGSRLYDFMFMQSFNDDRFRYVRGWCIPYRD